jgi:hypothetical protein
MPIDSVSARLSGKLTDEEARAKEWLPGEAWLHTGQRVWEPYTGERTYYEVHSGSGTTAFEIINQDIVRYYGVGPYWEGRGFPDYEGIPVLKFDPRRKIIADWRLDGCYWVVSNRTRELLEKLDGDAFDFRPTISSQGKNPVPGGPFWLCDVIRVLDAVDEERSELYMGQTQTVDGTLINRRYQGIHLARFRPEIVGEAHVFDLARNSMTVVDDIFLKAITNAKITGIGFSDLQSIDRANRRRRHYSLPPLSRPEQGA